MQQERRTDKITRCALELDARTKRPVVEVDGALVRAMKPHQIEGVKFLYRTMIESVRNISRGEPGGGAILAHCMGLGKTFLSICFLHTLLTHKVLKNFVKRVIVFCPCNVLLNWAKEFEMWITMNDTVRDKLNIHEFCRMKTLIDRMNMLEAWNQNGGVLIMSYSMFRVMTQTIENHSVDQEVARRLPELLHDPGADFIICDEGHTLKSAKSKISKAMNMIRTQRRLILTGTPLQNNMIEYHCMVNFVRPDTLGTLKEFNERFVQPITLGHKADADKSAVRLMKTRAHILNKLLGGCVHRCDYNKLVPYLPPKYEYVISINLSALQMKLYRRYLKFIGVNRNTTQEDLKRRVFLRDYQILKMVWSHPCLVVASDDRQENRRLKKIAKAEKLTGHGSDEESVLEDTINGTDSRESIHGDSDHETLRRPYKNRSASWKDPWGNDDHFPGDNGEKPIKPWWEGYVSREEDGIKNLELSSKFVVAFEILKQCEQIKDKVILFSTSLLTLDLFERQLEAQQHERLKGAGENESVGRWEHGVDYFRVDGRTGAGARKEYIEHFNNPNNERARLFLVSTKAGGLGINMIGANRIIVVDASWNPSDDTQAVFRAYRFGQTKPVYIYRLLAHATMEEKIYHRQVDKIALACRVVDEKNLERHFKGSELKALYEFKPQRKSRKAMALPKDRLLADLLIKCKHLIKGYHEHDSLLRKDAEDELTDGMRKQAWIEYENERQDNPCDETLLTPDQEQEDLLSNLDFQDQLQFPYRQSVTTQTSEERLRNSLLYDRPTMDPREIFKQIKRMYPDVDQLNSAMCAVSATLPARKSSVSSDHHAKRSARTHTTQDISVLTAALQALAEMERSHLPSSRR